LPDINGREIILLGKESTYGRALELDIAYELRLRHTINGCSQETATAIPELPEIQFMIDLFWLSMLSVPFKVIRAIHESPSTT
jgi:hypothetical protein